MLSPTTAASRFNTLSKWRMNQQLKRSLQCNQKFIAYYASILMSFIIAHICVLIAVFIWIFVQLYHYYCILFDIKSELIPLKTSNQYSKKQPLHIAIVGPFESGSHTYINILSQLHHLNILNINEFIKMSDNKRDFKIFFSELQKYCNNRQENWIMDLSSNYFFIHKYILPLTTHLIWIDHPQFIIFSRLCLKLYFKCIFGKNKWVHTFAVWDKRCDIMWQCQNIKTYKKIMLLKYKKYCNINKCKLIRITDIQQENKLLKYT
eukprot:383094_1